MKLLVGLGNPGVKSAGNRHNVGFMAVERIAERHGAGPWRGRFQGEAADALLGGEKCLLLKPQTYMNESGRSVGEAARFYKIELDDVVVFHDELDLAPGKMRVKTGGGVAGHNGLRSLTAHIGNDYRRVRIGIGHPGHKDKVHSHVLKDFSRGERDWLEPLLDAMADAAPRLAEGDDANFMNEVARAIAPAADEDPQPKPSRRERKAERPDARALARAQAERDEARPSVPEAADETDGPLARMLRKWRGGNES